MPRRRTLVPGILLDRQEYGPGSRAANAGRMGRPGRERDGSALGFPRVARTTFEVPARAVSRRRTRYQQSPSRVYLDAHEHTRESPVERARGGTRASPQVGSALAIPRQATRERHASRGSRRLPRCGRTIRRREKSLARRRGCRRRGRGRGGGGGALSSRISSRARRRRGRRGGAGGVARPSRAPARGDVRGGAERPRATRAPRTPVGARVFAVVRSVPAGEAQPDDAVSREGGGTTGRRTTRRGTGSRRSSRIRTRAASRTVVEPRRRPRFNPPVERAGYDRAVGGLRACAAPDRDRSSPPPRDVETTTKTSNGNSKHSPSTETKTRTTRRERTKNSTMGPMMMGFVRPRPAMVSTAASPDSIPGKSRARVRFSEGGGRPGHVRIRSRDVLRATLGTEDWGEFRDARADGRGASSRGGAASSARFSVHAAPRRRRGGESGLVRGRAVESDASARAAQHAFPQRVGG